MNQNKKKKIISIFCVLSLMLIAVGVTYSIFTYTKQGDTDNTITTVTGINITNAFPVNDEALLYENIKAKAYVKGYSSIYSISY